MFLDPRSTRVFLYREYVDMRKAHNGLSAIVTQVLKLDPLSGSIFLFVSRNRKIAKALLWDGTGFMIIHKKLERGRIMSFASLREVREITAQELGGILSGARVVLDVNLI